VSVPQARDCVTKSEAMGKDKGGAQGGKDKGKKDKGKKDKGNKNKDYKYKNKTGAPVSNQYNKPYDRNASYQPPSNAGGDAHLYNQASGTATLVVLLHPYYLFWLFICLYFECFYKRSYFPL
jgi:hypothetical protein